MRLTALTIPVLLVLPSISANLATDSIKWASSLMGADEKVQVSKVRVVHTMDSWSYVDCGASEFASLLSSYWVEEIRADPLFILSR